MTKAPASYGLLIDFDGTIGDTEDSNARCAADAFKKRYNIELSEMPPELFQDGIGTGQIPYLQSAAEKLVAAGLLERIPGQDILESLRDDWNQFMIPDLEKTPLPLISGMRELLDAALSDSRFAVCIVSSCGRELLDKMIASGKVPVEKMGLVCGDDIEPGRSKPAPDLFLKGAEFIKLSPERCLALEDAVKGVQSAVAAGCPTVGLENVASPRAKLLEAGALKVVPNFDGLSLDRAIGLIESAN